MIDDVEKNLTHCLLFVVHGDQGYLGLNNLMEHFHAPVNILSDILDFITVSQVAGLGTKIFMTYRGL